MRHTTRHIIRLLSLSLIIFASASSCTKEESINDEINKVLSKEEFTRRLENISTEYNVHFEFEETENTVYDQRLLDEVESIIKKGSLTSSSRKTKGDYDHLNSFTPLYVSHSHGQYGESYYFCEFMFQSKEIYSGFILEGQCIVNTDPENGGGCYEYNFCNGKISPLNGWTFNLDDCSLGSMISLIIECTLDFHTSSGERISIIHIFDLTIRINSDDSLEATGTFIQ